MREIRTPGSVGASGSNSRGDPTDSDEKRENFSYPLCTLFLESQRPSQNLVGCDLRDLGPLDADAAHQPLLIEDEGVDVRAQVGGGQ